MSSEGAQLLLALISCGDFLTVQETPRCLGLWEPDYLGKDEQLVPHTDLPLKRHCFQPSGDRFAGCWTCVERGPGKAGSDTQ